MQATKKIPLSIAILLSINIVVGGGFFISANKVFASSGALAPLPWLLCGLLLVPLVVVLASLSRRYPTAGGLYVYSKKNLGGFWGFISGWGYFIGTLAGNAIVLHAFSNLTKELGFPLPLTSYFSPQTSQLILDLFFILFFTIINLFNITVLEKLSVGFTILKTIPFGLVLLSMFFLFDVKNVMAAPIKPSGLLSTMPLALFAYIGIEACCAISHKIKDGEKNSARAMLISLGIIIATYSIVQFGLLGIVGASSGVNPFFAIVPKLTANPVIISWGNLFVKIAILSSYLGGFYSMYYANSWNLYALAKEKSISFSNPLAKLNKHHTPWVAIIVQGLLIALLLMIAFTSLETLMTMSGFGVVIAYILSALTYFVANPNKKSKYVMGSLAFVGCAALLILCFNDLYNDGIRYLLPFLAILGSGLFLYKSSR